MSDDSTPATSETNAKADNNANADMRRGAVIRRLGPAAVLGVLWAVLPGVLGVTLFVVYRQEVSDWLQAQGVAEGSVIYIGAFMLAAGLGLLPTWVQAVIGGYAFGLWAGFGAAWAGFTGAALIGFVVTRLVAGRRVEREIESHAKAKAVRDALVGAGWLRTTGIVALVRAPFNSPFSLMNLTLCAAETPLSAYMVGTVVGMAPRTLVYAFMGAGMVSWDEFDKPWWYLPAGIASMIVVALIVAQVANRALAKISEPGDRQDRGGGERLSR